MTNKHLYNEVEVEVFKNFNYEYVDVLSDVDSENDGNIGSNQKSHELNVNLTFSDNTVLSEEFDDEEWNPEDISLIKVGEQTIDCQMFITQVKQSWQRIKI